MLRDSLSEITDCKLVKEEASRYARCTPEPALPCVNTFVSKPPRKNFNIKAIDRWWGWRDRFDKIAFCMRRGRISVRSRVPGETRVRRDDSSVNPAATK